MDNKELLEKYSAWVKMCDAYDEACDNNDIHQERVLGIEMDHALAVINNAARTELPRLVRENEALSKALYDLGWKCQWRKTGLLLVPLDIPIEPEEAP